ncbi:hypothetical protein [Streptomyces sp. NPDC058622]|uniref:hypothetical protein n=1 Tax=Streptomyces sp. NPDC058622 TaxID=3346562 RepID=UPI0036586D77
MIAATDTGTWIGLRDAAALFDWEDITRPEDGEGLAVDVYRPTDRHPVRQLSLRLPDP